MEVLLVARFLVLKGQDQLLWHGNLNFSHLNVL